MELLRHVECLVDVVGEHSCLETCVSVVHLIYRGQGRAVTCRLA
jgi:hypothetical protein